MRKQKKYSVLTLSATAIVAVVFASIWTLAKAPAEGTPAETIKKITKASNITPAEEARNELALSGSPPSDDGGVKAKVAAEAAPGTRAESDAKPESSSETSTHEAPAAKPAQAASHAHGDHADGVPADKALRWLMNGNTRYITKRIRADGRGPDDRKRLTAGQKPHTIVLSCSDSRVPPEVVFDQTLGEIFVIRVAGEAIDSSVIASIEYALEHLGSKLLVVMGHTKCGAVDAALKVKEGSSAGSESLDRLLADIRPRLRSVAGKSASADLEVESTLNADGVARDLLKRSEIIRKKVEAHELTIKPALYRLDSGKASFY